MPKIVSSEQVIYPQEPSVVVVDNNNQQLNGQQQHKKSVIEFTPPSTPPPSSHPPILPTRTSSQNIIDRIELKRAASNSDDQIAVNIDHLNESIYKINNFIRVSKDIHDLKREYTKRNDIKRNFSLKEQWLRNSGDNLNSSAQRINDLAHSIRSTKPPPVSQSTYDLRRPSLDYDSKLTNERFSDRIKSESIHNLQSPKNDQAISESELISMNHLTVSDKKINSLSDLKYNNKLPPVTQPSMRKIEAQNFSSTVDSIQSQLPPAPKVTTNTKALTDISRFFPKKEATQIPTNVNKNQKELKDVDLRKYFVPTPVQERSSLPSPIGTPKSGLSSPCQTPNSNLSPTVSRKNSLGTDTIMPNKQQIDLKQTLLRDKVTNKLKSHPSKQQSSSVKQENDNNFDSGSLYDQQLDGAFDVSYFQRKQFSKSFSNYNGGSIEDIDINQLLDNNENIDSVQNKEYNNLFDNLSIDTGSSIEAIFDEVASEVIIPSNKQQPSISPKSINNDTKLVVKHEKIRNIENFFGPKTFPNRIDPKDLTYHKSAPKWHKKEVVKQTDVNNDLYISKLPTKLQQQIKYLEDQLASAEPFAILDDLTSATDTPSTICTPKQEIEAVPPKKLKAVKKLKNKTTAKKIVIKPNKNDDNPMINKESKSDKMHSNKQINGMAMDDNITLLHEELNYSSANLSQSLNKLNEIVEKTHSTQKMVEPMANISLSYSQPKLYAIQQTNGTANVDDNITLLHEELRHSSTNLNKSLNKLNEIVEKKLSDKPTNAQKIVEPMISQLQTTAETVTPPIRKLFKYKPLDGSVLQRHIILKSPMYPKEITNQQLDISLPQNATLSNNAQNYTNLEKSSITQEKLPLNHDEDSKPTIKTNLTDNIHETKLKQYMHSLNDSINSNPIEDKQMNNHLNHKTTGDEKKNVQLDRKISLANLQKEQQEKYLSYGSHYAAKMNMYRLDEKINHKSVQQPSISDDDTDNKLSHSQKLEKFRKEIQLSTENDTRKQHQIKTLYDNPSAIQPERPARRKIDESSTKELIERSQKIHTRKQEFMNAKMASANPYMKKLIDDNDNDDDSDNIHCKLKSPTKLCYNSVGNTNKYSHLSSKTSTPSMTNGNGILASTYRKPTSSQQQSSSQRNLINLFRRNPMPTSSTVTSYKKDSVPLPSASKKSASQRSSRREACNIS